MNANSEHERQVFTVVRGGWPKASPVLMNLIRDTSTPVLIYMAERYGLRRVPGISRGDLVDRILRSLPAEALDELLNDLIAARYGSRSVEELLGLVLLSDEQRLGRGKPRLDDMPAEDATLIQGGERRWLFTMHSHDVVIDMSQRRLACGCPFFRFASYRHALCKHLARALTLIPETYAREILIDLLVGREYGGPDTPGWDFHSLRAA